MSVLCRCDDSIITSPPRPPSPPDGPPRGTNFSRRKAMQPLPPSPAFTRILASSINICPSQSTESSTLHSPIQDVSESIGKSRVPCVSILRRGMRSIPPRAAVPSRFNGGGTRVGVGTTDVDRFTRKEAHHQSPNKTPPPPSHHPHPYGS